MVYEIQFAVKDTGIGIPPERMDRLFKPFSQVDASTTRCYGGTGLGLVISQRLSHMMGGQMWVESQVGFGSTFYFTLTAPSVSDSMIDLPPANAILFDAQLAQRLPLRILLVEDIVVNQKVAVKMLEQLGYRADVANDGEEALNALQRQTYDVVLMDVQMPRMDGFEASRRICQSWADTARPWIIAMTAHARLEDREMCLKAGMNDYVSKPIRLEALAKALTQVKGQQQLSELELETQLSTNPNVVNSEALISEPLSTTQEQTISAFPTLDLEVLDGLRSLMMDDEDDLLTQVIESYLEDAPKRLQAIHQAIGQNDANTIRKSAHALRSLSATVGAAAFAHQCEILETLAQQEKLQNTGVIYIQLEKESTRVAIALQNELEKISS
ncbi:MAG: response regulator [Leptolyngbyaceae cyanobacterium CRU_2_3]|nr:response regulator [Leptolyngbyaceae cyanobacterium CRU_2_3]